MLSWLVLGAFWDSFELFGSLWDLPWELLEPLSGILGALLGLPGLVGPLLGCSFGPPKRLGKRSLEETVCSVAKRAVGLHALRHKASADPQMFP